LVHVDDLSDSRHENEPPQFSGADHSPDQQHDDNQDTKIDRRIELKVVDCCVPVRRVPNFVDEPIRSGTSTAQISLPRYRWSFAMGALAGHEVAGRRDSPPPR
jgi:hypothetical protein